MKMKHENFDAHHPDGEKSQILSIPTTQIDYALNLIKTLRRKLAYSILAGSAA